MTFKICEDVPVRELRRLAAQVCLTAFDELKSQDVLRALDAAYWVTGPDFAVWAEWAGLPFADPVQVKEFRRRIVPALEVVRREVIATVKPKKANKPKKTKGNDDRTTRQAA